MGIIPFPGDKIAISPSKKYSRTTEGPNDDNVTYTEITLVFVIFTCSAFGNGLVCAAGLQNRNLRTRTNIFLFSLSLIDFTIAFTCILPVGITLALNSHTWLNNRSLCSTLAFLMGFLHTMSTYCLAGVACLRFFKIVLFPKYTGFFRRRTISLYLTCVVVISVAINSLPFFGIGKFEFSRGHATCFVTMSTKNRKFGYLFYVFGVILPFMIMTVCYLSILYKMKLQRLAVLSHRLSRTKTVITFRKLRTERVRLEEVSNANPKGMTISASKPIENECFESKDLTTASTTKQQKLDDDFTDNERDRSTHQAQQTLTTGTMEGKKERQLDVGNVPRKISWNLTRFSMKENQRVIERENRTSKNEAELTFCEVERSGVEQMRPTAADSLLSSAGNTRLKNITKSEKAEVKCDMLNKTFSSDSSWNKQARKVLDGMKGNSVGTADKVSRQRRTSIMLGETKDDKRVNYAHAKENPVFSVIREQNFLNSPTITSQRHYFREFLINAKVSPQSSFESGWSTPQLGPSFDNLEKSKGKPSAKKTTTKQQHSRGKYHKRVTMNTFLVVIAYFISWLPSFVITNISIHSGGNYEVSDTAILFGQLFVFLSACVNPVIYAMRDDKFRKCFKKMFKSVTRSLVGRKS